MEWIRTKDKLPKEGKYVLARHNRGTWNDSTDQQNVNCVVVKLIKGITEDDRVLMRAGKLDDPEEITWCLSEGSQSTKRSNLYKSEDVFGSNIVAYKWKMFGRNSFFGQTITHWLPIEPLI